MTHWPFHDPPHAQDGNLRHVDDRAEVIDLEHPQVGNGKSAIAKLIQVQASAAGQLDQALSLPRDLLQQCTDAAFALEGNRPQILPPQADLLVLGPDLKRSTGVSPSRT